MIIEAHENILEELSNCVGCVKFSHGTDRSLNQVDASECCYYLFLKNWSCDAGIDDTNKICDRTMTAVVEVLHPSDLGRVLYNEKGQDKSEGRYEEHIKFLEECFLDCYLQQLCGCGFSIERLRYKPIYGANYDTVFDGLSLTITIKNER